LGLPGHMDEYDYLFVGKILTAGDEWPTLTYIFGSDFNWYLLGWSERLFDGFFEILFEDPLNGLRGARIVPALCGIVSLLFTGLITHHLWKSRAVATVAVVLLAISAPHIHISRLATYDIISFSFFTASLYTLLLACSKGQYRYAKLCVGVLLFTAAVLSKYVVLLFIPVVGGVMLVMAPGMALSACLLLGGLLGAYVLFNKNELLVLYQHQISVVHGANADRVELVLIILPYLAVPLVLCAIGILAMTIRQFEFSGSLDNAQFKKNRSILIASLFLSTPLIAYHLYESNLISLYKHSVYSVFFLTPISAWVMTRLVYSRVCKSISSRLVPIASIGLALCTAVQMHSIEKAFPDVLPLMRVSTELIGPDAKVLSEDPYLFRYTLFGELEQSQINEMGWLDFNSDGVHESNDVVQALQKRHFDFVFLNDQINPDSNHIYRKILDERDYRLVYTENYKLSAAMTKNRSGSLALYQRVKQLWQSDQPMTAAPDL